MKTMTYKHCGWLAGFCFLGMLASAGMTETGQIDLFSGMAIMLALLAIGAASGKVGLQLYAYEQQRRYRGRYR